MLQFDHHRIIYPSLTRIADLAAMDLHTRKVEYSIWNDGDYVLVRVTEPGALRIELTNGRMSRVMTGDILVGALGTRHATLEATGTYRAVKDDLDMYFLTGAGLLGAITSKSPFIPELVHVRYLGHLYEDDHVLNMADFMPYVPATPYTTPTVAFVGTSMSSGKTSSARVVTQILKSLGLSVAGAKLTGAGRYQDILALHDAGADAIYDFVDVGLPSSVVDKEVYEARLKLLLSLIQQAHADVAVVEIGASPLEPYNGSTAIAYIRDHVACRILCASDPYAVLGVMQAFKTQPDIVGGPASNTLGGIELIDKLCHVHGINIIDPANRQTISEILISKLGIKASSDIEHRTSEVMS